MLPYEELAGCSTALGNAAACGDSPEVNSVIEALKAAAEDMGRSFSGSWLGYHSHVYYAGLNPPPPGAHFSQEWGFNGEEWLGLGSSGDWREFSAEQVKEEILRRANHPNLEGIRKISKDAEKIFADNKSEILSIVENELDRKGDAFLEKLKSELDQLSQLSKHDVINIFRPKGQILTRDTTALGQGTQLPPHMDVLADIFSVAHAFGICKSASELASKGAAHLGRKSRHKKSQILSGSNIFIGHGRSPAWRELKDFIERRLSLPWDEFNRIPVAGITNVARLSEMLDSAAIAFLIMTAEDQAADGEFQARMNVIHEAGLFQGRLGFTRAIVLLEDGCREFSNIQGLGQLRFPKGNISASFEGVRMILEREALLK